MSTGIICSGNYRIKHVIHKVWLSLSHLGTVGHKALEYPEPLIDPFSSFLQSHNGNLC